MRPKLCRRLYRDLLAPHVHGIGLCARARHPRRKKLVGPRMNGALGISHAGCVVGIRARTYSWDIPGCVTDFRGDVRGMYTGCAWDVRGMYAGSA